MHFSQALKWIQASWTISASSGHGQFLWHFCFADYVHSGWDAGGWLTCILRWYLGRHPMGPQNTKQKTNSQLQESFRFLSSLRYSVIDFSFSALHFPPPWDGTLKDMWYLVNYQILLILGFYMFVPKIHKM